MCNYVEETALLKRICQLIQMKATGTPKDLANRLEISERNLYYLIRFLKDQGFPIKYNKVKQRYEFEKNVRITLFHCAILDNDQMSEIIGGKNSTHYTPTYSEKENPAERLSKILNFNRLLHFYRNYLIS